jgi:hypothetical protein
MLLNGWGVLFNLLTYASGSAAEEYVVTYAIDSDEGDPPNSPLLTTALLAVFWATGAALLAAMAG